MKRLLCLLLCLTLMVPAALAEDTLIAQMSAEALGRRSPQRSMPSWRP